MSKRPIAKTRIGKDEGRKSKRINFKLYLITDRKQIPPYPPLLKGGKGGLIPSAEIQNLLAAVKQALKGGVRAVQLREKDLGTRELLKLAYRMREHTNKYNARLFINDRVDIALAVEADGVHLTQNSIPADAVRRAVQSSIARSPRGEAAGLVRSQRVNRQSSRFLIGVSTHSLKEARQAEEAGADFVTFGPVYRTPSKVKYGEPVGTDRLIRVVRQINIPVFAIGGVKSSRIKDVKKTGANGVAMISGIFKASDIQNKANEIINLLEDR